MSYSARSLRPRVTAPLLGALVAAFLLVQLASAHASPVKFVPAQGAVLTTAPTEASIDTASPMASGAGNDIVVRNAAGTAVTTSHASVDATRTHMTVPLPADLPAGTYTAHWSTVSGEDGEADSGSWTFTYNPAGAAQPGAQPTAPASASSGASIALTNPTDGATVSTSSLTLALRLTNVVLVPMDGSAAPAGSGLPGHLHVMVDGRMLGMPSSASGITIVNLADGVHTIMVELVAPNHSSYDPPITTTAHITVTGSNATGNPRLDTAPMASATASGTATMGSPAVTPTAPRTGNGDLTRSFTEPGVVVGFLVAALTMTVVARRFVASDRR